MGLMAVGIVVLANRRRQVGRLLRTNGPILLFFCYCALSLVWSDFPGVAFKRWIKAVGDLVMILIVLSDREPLTAINTLLARLTYVLIPCSILFIKYYPELGASYGPWGGGASLVGVATSKNVLGAVCLGLGLGALWRFLTAYRGRKVPGRTWRMIAEAVILAMVFWLLRVTNSMTALSSFVMAGTLLLAANMRSVIRRPAVVHLLMASMLIVSCSVLFLGASADVLQTMGRDPTLTDRTAIWGTVLSLVRNPLLGAGFESFWLGPRLDKIWSLYWFHPMQAHNGYLEVFLNLGWTGVALLVVVIVAGYRAVFLAWRNDASRGSLMLSLFFAGLVFNFTEAAFFRMEAPAWLFFLLAVVSAPTVSRTKRGPSAANLPRTRLNYSEATVPDPVPEGHMDPTLQGLRL
jgi:O-antigen ligase